MTRYESREAGVYDRGAVPAPRVIYPGELGWADFQAWLDAGNVPDPAPPIMAHVSTPEELAALAELATRDQVAHDLTSDATVQAFRKRTPAQVDAWIDANVNSLADARAVLKIAARILALLARERLRDA